VARCVVVRLWFPDYNCCLTVGICNIYIYIYTCALIILFSSAMYFVVGAPCSVYSAVVVMSVVKALSVHCRCQHGQYLLRTKVCPVI
jgi:hypothetical protein